VHCAVVVCVGQREGADPLAFPQITGIVEVVEVVEDPAEAASCGTAAALPRIAHCREEPAGERPRRALDTRSDVYLRPAIEHGYQRPAIRGPPDQARHQADEVKSRQARRGGEA